MKIFTGETRGEMKVADLMKRYNIGTRQGVTKFVQTNLAKINAESNHARKKVSGYLMKKRSTLWKN